MHTTDWRCRRCDKKLGELSGNKVFLRFTRGHEYVAHLPATASCRACGTLNEQPVTPARPLAAAATPAPATAS
jgi:hypothetical protein